MLKRAIIAGSLLAVLTVMNLATSAEAKRRCPRGYEDVNNVCIKVPGHG